MKTLLVEEIKTRLNEGTPDEELMRAYGLSSDQLNGLYDQLVRAMAYGSPYVHIGPEKSIPVQVTTSPDPG